MKLRRSGQGGSAQPEDEHQADDEDFAYPALTVRFTAELHYELTQVPLVLECKLFFRGLWPRTQISSTLSSSGNFRQSERQSGKMGRTAQRMESRLQPVRSASSQELAMCRGVVKGPPLPAEAGTPYAAQSGKALVLGQALTRKPAFDDQAFSQFQAIRSVEPEECCSGTALCGYADDPRDFQSEVVRPSVATRVEQELARAALRVD